MGVWLWGFSSNMDLNSNIFFWVGMLIYLPVIQFPHRCTSSAQLSTPYLYIRSNHWYLSRHQSELGDYEVNFQVNPLMHVAPLLLWYNTATSTLVSLWVNPLHTCVTRDQLLSEEMFICGDSNICLKRKLICGDPSM